MSQAPRPNGCPRAEEDARAWARPRPLGNAMMPKAPLGRVSDFSPIAARYDATRDLPERSLLACYDRLVEGGLFPARGAVLDAGCGTGQVSLPLAARGYEIRGIDISKEMVEIARAKLR